MNPKKMRPLLILIIITFILIATTSCKIVLPSSNTSNPETSSAGATTSVITGSPGTTSPVTPPVATPGTGGSGKVIIPGNFGDNGTINLGKFKTSKLLKINDSMLHNIGRIIGGSGGTGSNAPSRFALTDKDIKMPVLSFVGRGYDVFDNYASANYVKEGQILDLGRLVKDGRVFRDDITDSNYKEITASSARSYATYLATSVKLSGSYLYFSGSVKSNFSSSHLEQASSYFSTIFYNISLYSLYIDPAVNLSDYVTKETQDILQTRDARWIFANYGTHLVRSLQAGGRFDYSTCIDKQYVKDEKNFSSSVKASFNAVFASAGAQVETSSTTVTEDYTENSEVRIFTYGGDGIDGQSMKCDPQTLKNWMESVKTTPSVCDFGDNALIPIWDLCKDPARKKYLQEEFDKYAQEKLSIIPSSFAVNGLRLNIVNVKDPIISDFKDDTGEWFMVSNISAHTMLPEDKMAILYARYGRIDDAENAPVVEIILENAKEQENVKAYFEEKYKNDKTARLFGWNGTHNINGSNLGISLNQQMAISAGAPEMYLFYVTSSAETSRPVKSVIVRHISTNGETKYFPYPPEPNKKYEQILDRTLQNNGKIMAQDTGEGAGAYYKQNMFNFALYKNHFIEYTFD